MFTPTIKLEHSDSRGEIYSIELPNGHELMLLHSVAGALRGGHSHDCPEVVMVLSGQMAYHKDPGTDSTEKVTVMSEGQASFNHVGQIHLGEFLKDCWLIEYKFAKKGEWRQENYEPFRERVNASQR